MKNKVKKIPKKTMLAFIICAVTFSMIGASASTLLYSKDVTYDNSSSGLSSTNLQDALDELYEQAKNAPSCDSNGVCTVTCPSGLNYFATSTGYLCVPGSVSFGGKSISIVTSGDGLYADSVTSGRYFYRGTTVDNYITFNDETWRIISVESDGTLKIIRNEQLPDKLSWDAAGTRDSSTSTYCTDASSYGCNAWAATSNLVGTPSTFVQYYPNGTSVNAENTYPGTVTGDASLNTYLNRTYYSGLSSTAKAKVVKGTFNVSTPGNNGDTETLEVDAEQEKQYQWKGYVALMTATELLRASTSSGCTSLSAGNNHRSTNACISNNWLWSTFNTYSFEATLSPDANNDNTMGCSLVWVMTYLDGYAGSSNTRGPFAVRPVLHLSSDITLSGSGTESDPYVIS